MVRRTFGATNRSGEGAGEKAQYIFGKEHDMRSFIAGLMASLVLVTPLQARAPTSVSVHISTVGLDLSTPEGVAALKKRSVVAIRKACADLAYPLDTYQSCRIQAEAEAMKQIEHRRQSRLAMLTSPIG
jgi:UrcA family protein